MIAVAFGGTEMKTLMVLCLAWTLLFPGAQYAHGIFPECVSQPLQKRRVRRTNGRARPKREEGHIDEGFSSYEETSNSLQCIIRVRRHAISHIIWQDTISTEALPACVGWRLWESRIIFFIFSHHEFALREFIWSYQAFHKNLQNVCRFGIRLWSLKQKNHSIAHQESFNPQLPIFNGTKWGSTK